MPVYKTARFAVRSEELEACLAAIREFVRYIDENEPGTRLYLALQEEGEVTRFLHVFVFDDAAAEQRHTGSEAVRRFTGSLYPRTVAPVEFTEYRAVATT